MERHLLQDLVVASKGRIDHGEIPIVREIEEVLALPNTAADRRFLHSR